MWRLVLTSFVAICAGAACGDDATSDDDGSGGSETSGSGGSGAAAAGSGGVAGAGGAGASSAGGGAALPMGFTGDCSTARWADVSNECWACACETCAETVNACDESCADVLECALSEPCLVGVAEEVPCEVQCVVDLCVTGDAGPGDAFAGAANFDSCLIANAPSGQFRACEVECGIAYTRPVCEDFPAP